MEEWSENSSVLSFEDKLLACLKSSLDFLGERDVKLKECFMDLASFPEDTRIPATALIDMWTELHGLKESHAAANLFELHHWNMANVVVTRYDGLAPISSFMTGFFFYANCNSYTSSNWI